MGKLIERRKFLKHFLQSSGCFVLSLHSHPMLRANSLPKITSASPLFHFPQGLASGDPTDDSVILWTRVESLIGSRAAVELTLELSLDSEFEQIIMRQSIIADADSDHTVRVFVDGLKSSHWYYYRFFAGTDKTDLTGRTRTAPPPNDNQKSRFAQVSCQHLQLGHMTPYRHMIEVDELRAGDEQIEFVLHLGDFIYEEVWYPEEKPFFLERKVRDTLRFPDGKKIDDYKMYYPVTLADYRMLYKSYLKDPDLRAARARWPFICTWDDHEFSNDSWQSQQNYEGEGSPAQKRKVASNQAWFEFIPAFLTNISGVAGVPQHAHDFSPVKVENKCLDKFDDTNLSLEPNNFAAIHSMTIYRSLRWGKNIELVVTDTRSYRSRPVMHPDIDSQTNSPNILWFKPKEIIDELDAGKTFNHNFPNRFLTSNGKKVPNPRFEAPIGTILGKRQKQWFKATLKNSNASWKIWANSIGLLPRRVDFQNLPKHLRNEWIGSSEGVINTDDWDGYPGEREEIYQYVSRHGIDNFVSLAGDRHMFSAGYLQTKGAQQSDKRIGVEFGVSSITTPSSYDVYQYVLQQGASRNHSELNGLWLHRYGMKAREKEIKYPTPTVNMTFLHGVQSSLLYEKTGSLEKALNIANKSLNTHLDFIDCSKHGYMEVCVEDQNMQVDVVAFNAPVTSKNPKSIYRLRFLVEKFNEKQPVCIKRIKNEGEMPFPDIGTINKQVINDDLKKE